MRFVLFCFGSATGFPAGTCSVVQCSPHCQNGLCCILYMVVVDTIKILNLNDMGFRGLHVAYTKLVDYDFPISS